MAESILALIIDYFAKIKLMKYSDTNFWKMTAVFLLIIVIGLLGVYWLDGLAQLR